MIELTQEQIQMIQDIARRECFKNYAVEVSNFTSKGDGFMGNILNVGIKEKKLNKSISVIIKTARGGEEREKAPIGPCYQREIYMYNKVLHQFEKFQNAYKIKNKFNSVPKLIAANSDEFSEILALENLKESGYKMLNWKNSVDGNHIALTFRELGKFHALSFALKHLEPKTFDNLTKNLDSIFQKFFTNEHLFVSIRDNINKAAKALSGNPEAYQALKTLDVEAVEWIRKFYDYRDKYSVIAHGDLWGNNILFKYGNRNAPTKVQFVDFQNSFLTTPVSDLMQFLCCCVTGENLKRHKEYLKVYHDSLSQMLNQFGLKAADVFPFEELERQWKLFIKYGIIAAFFYLNFLMEDFKELGELKEQNSFLDIFSTDVASDEYNKRVKILVNVMLENGYL